MTTEHPDDRDRVEVLGPDEAMSRAGRCRRRKIFDGLSPQQWAAFYEALAE